MEPIRTYLAMGGYAAFVWPAYAVAAVILIAFAIDSWRHVKRATVTLRLLDGQNPRNDGDRQPPPVSRVRFAGRAGEAGRAGQVGAIMTRKTRRIYLIVISLVLLGAATGLVLNALSDKIVFFFSPTQIAERPPVPGQVVRLGGLVESGSVHKTDDAGTTAFRVTDLRKTVDVSYRGILPDLFREGQGVVVQGSYSQAGQFVALDVLAKHDEKYMPPEVAKALKASGRWQETAAQPGTQTEPGMQTEAGKQTGSTTQ